MSGLDSAQDPLGTQDEPDGDAVWVEITDGAMRRRLLRPGQQGSVGADRSGRLRIHDGSSPPGSCRIEHRGHEVRIVDVGAAGGLYVGCARVERAGLPLDGAFRIGPSWVRLRPVRGGDGGARLPGVVGGSPAMRRLAVLVRRCAALSLPALITGESGVGKELVARALHRWSGVAAGPFVAINAATLEPALADSELFGHCRGAFTGAQRDRPGAFRRAHQGTLFIDEVAALPRAVQSKLLRVVEEGSVTPVGGDEPVRVAVRLLSATCEPLEMHLQAGSFRPDLYQRLAACVLRVPPLRERRGDLSALARHLLAACDLGSRELDREALAQLQAHDWPGNVRELRNVLVQAAMLADGLRIEAPHVAIALGQGRRRSPLRIAPEVAIRLLAEAEGNISAAARRAGLPRTTFRDLARRAGRLAARGG